MQGTISRLARLTAAAVVVLGCAAGAASAKDEITLIAGPVGGGWYLIAGGLADILQTADPDLTVKVIPGGGLVNPARVSTHDADFGLSLAVNTEMARVGKDPYEEKYENNWAIAFGFNVSYFQILADPSLGIDRFEQVFEKKLPLKLTTPGLQTMGGWTIAKLFQHHGASIAALKDWGGAHYVANFARQTDLLRDGQADSVALLLQLPSPPFVEIGTTRALRFLTLSEGLRNAMVKDLGYVHAVVPKDTYKGSKLILEADYPTIAVTSGLIAHKDTPDEMVYRFTKALFENAERVQKTHKSMRDFVPEKIVSAANRGNIPLHPGAERYFEEKGYNYR